MKACLKELYTVGPTTAPGNSPYVKYFGVLQFLLDLCEKADNEIDADLLQILATVLPFNKTKAILKKNSKYNVLHIKYILTN